MHVLHWPRFTPTPQSHAYRRRPLTKVPIALATRVDGRIQHVPLFGRKPDPDDDDDDDDNDVKVVATHILVASCVAASWLIFDLIHQM